MLIRKRQISGMLMTFLLLVGLAFPLSAQSQSSHNTNNNAINKAAWDSIKGTYQIQVINAPRKQPYLPADLPKQINNNRLSAKVNYLKLSSKVRIKILPEQRIQSPTFQPVKERIEYIRK